MTSVLIATLGAEPQVVSLATQLLQRSHAPIARVIVLHTDPTMPPLEDALARLRAAFATHPSLPSLAFAQIPASDVLTPRQMDLFGETLFTQIQQAQTAGLRVHLLLAGGRKSMTMVGMSIAHLLLGADDAVWYLYSEPGLRKSGRMLLEPADHAELVPIPLPQVNLAAPRYTPAGRAASRADALLAAQRLAADQARTFLQQDLTHAEREVAALVARELLTVSQIAQRLHKSPKTVTNQLTSIYSKLESRFGLEPSQSVKREFLRRELSPYLDGTTRHPTQT